jgi:isopenicillin-N epimerase
MNAPRPLSPAADDHAAWEVIGRDWQLREGTVYLNHGSFGPSPAPVRTVQQEWLAQIESQPMDFFVRCLEPALDEARARLAQLVGTTAEKLVFVENATYGMNVVAQSLELKSGDEVLLTDHEYGAVLRIWQRACGRVDVAEPKVAELPLPFESAEQTVDALLSVAGEKTRLIVVSHITSPTAAILPVASICRAARARGIAVAIDGPHAPVQVPLDIDSLDCDFYTASCHKWLCAPFGSGFLYVHPRQQQRMQPLVQSWGRLPPGDLGRWDDEFYWSGTRDYSAYLAVPRAVDYFETIGLPAVRQRMHYLAQYARRQLVELTGLTPIVPDSPDWYGSMAHVPLPDGDASTLQKQLWERFGIEVPIVDWRDRRFVRVSCHVYNTTAQIDRLVAALRNLL